MSTFRERFEKKISPEPMSGCWLWDSTVDNKGYGVIRRHPKRLAAHRVSYELYKGEIPSGMVVMHKCDNTICVNPDHLTLGTVKENVQDMIIKGRKKTATKLTKDQVCKIKYHSKNVTQANLARKFNVSAQQIYRIQTGVHWKHI